LPDAGKTDVAPQHKSQSIDLIEFRQTLSPLAPQRLLRSNNSNPENWLFRPHRFPSADLRIGGHQAPPSTLPNNAKS
jgi:hypothetical protein